ncbi:glucose 1-dehydrogenase [Opitutus sp. GAS368]|uniref:glucose 1-dehydrogenase n=1 Tax=Opitutus sp. GAS368 TaxID=1882749 RepID=UPI00087BB009|nr:glucose 1-dehydrogenase [Opitutus sp. GAS368]SDS10440.1 3-oxoacyl-[acyl-carrier protein] reductase [Opitutus sp. GAS368]
MKSNIQPKLTGKIALVTGASKGVGASIAKHLAAAGASVVVNYASSKAGADQVVAEITAAGGRAVAIQGDVAKPADITRLLAETKKTFGHLDILVNNAGVYEFQPLEAITVEHYHRIFNINVLGLLLTTQEAVKHFPATGGSIINVGSVVTDLTPPASAVYTGTKGAVDAITGVLAKELGPKKIRVNALNPGLTITEGTHTAGIAGSDFERDAVSKTPLGRAGQPQDIAKAAVFLASDDSGWITGEQLRVGGGIY